GQRNHGWGQDIEVLVLLYSLAHGLSLSVVGSAFGIPKSTVHRTGLLHNSAPVQMAPHLREHDYI
ncbi:hypothetical protein KUCAC02_017559, partial [Chaenocephalus aceratus]